MFDEIIHVRWYWSDKAPGIWDMLRSLRRSVDVTVKKRLNYVQLIELTNASIIRSSYRGKSIILLLWFIVLLILHCSYKYEAEGYFQSFVTSKLNFTSVHCKISCRLSFEMNISNIGLHYVSKFWMDKS